MGSEEPMQCSGRCDGITAGVPWTHESIYFSKISSAMIRMCNILFLYMMYHFTQGSVIRHLGEDVSDKKEAFTPWLL